MKRLRKVGIVLGIIVLVFLGLFLKMKNQADQAMKGIHNVDINMENVADGTYEGYTDAGLVKVEVEVTVVNHRIEDIQILKHDNGKGKPAESIVDDMIEQNTDQVDIVSGATLSSKTIQNAVNKALQKGLES